MSDIENTTKTNKNDHTKVLNYLSDQPWLATENSVKTIINIANGFGDPKAVEAKLGRPLNNTQTVEIRDGVAVLSINGPIFRYAVTKLPMLRKLDPTRLVALNSGGFHGEYGAFSLPYTEAWDTNIMDTHIYKTWPLSEEDMHLYRHTGESQKKVWLSEFGFKQSAEKGYREPRESFNLLLCWHLLIMDD